MGRRKKVIPMRGIVHFSNVNFDSQTGPNTFGGRLAVQLSMDHFTLAGHGEDYDVALAFIEPSYDIRKDRPLVLRLDGIWFKPTDFDYKNRTIKNAYSAADHVIFQSQFDKQMVESWWPKAKSVSVINNGIQLKQRIQVNDKLKKLRREYQKVFVCSASWHPQKRLIEVIELFKRFRLKYPSSALIVLGPNPDPVLSDPDIFYAGLQPHAACMQIYSIADWFIHLAWLDHCPNVVVEAMSVGCPIICTDSGGTHEIVKSNGIVIKDKPYKFELTDYDSPPPLDLTQLFELPEKSSIEMSLDHIDIVGVAKQYGEVLERFAKCSKPHSP